MTRIHSRKLKMRWLVLLASLGAVLGCGAGYAGLGGWMLRREIAATPRDPATGIILGAAARDIDPPRLAGVRSADRPTSACLLIHGFGGTPTDFNDLGRALAARGYHVRMMLLPGHGTTPADFARQTPETLYAGVDREFHALKAHYAEVNVIGFSMGGALATLLAGKEDVHRLVLTSPFYGVTYEWYYLLPAETWNALVSPFFSYIGKIHGYVPVNRPVPAGSIISYRVVSTASLRTVLALGRRASEPRALGAIQCPTLMLISPGDEVASPRAEKRAFAALGSTQKKAHWLPARSNHLLFWDYDREEATRTVLDFLAQS